MMRDLPPRIAGRLIPGVISRGNGDGVYLTFDDGPHPETTNKVLDVLSAQGCRATFFPLVARALRMGEIVKRILSEGHVLGVHGLEHRGMLTLGRTRARRLLSTAATELTALTGCSPRLFRPPYGRFGPGTLAACRELDLKLVLWSLNALDYKPFQPEELVRSVIRRARRGDILLLHDAGRFAAPMLQALPALISSLRNRGLEPSALQGDECSLSR